MQRTDSLEKALMLGEIEGSRRRELQRMRWLDGITDLMDKTSKTMLNSSGDSGHLCLIPGFRGITFNISPVRIMFAVI